MNSQYDEDRALEAEIRRLREQDLGTLQRAHRAEAEVERLQAELERERKRRLAITRQGERGELSGWKWRAERAEAEVRRLRDGLIALRDETRDALQPEAEESQRGGYTHVCFRKDMPG